MMHNALLTKKTKFRNKKLKRQISKFWGKKDIFGPWGPRLSMCSTQKSVSLVSRYKGTKNYDSNETKQPNMP